MMSFPPNTLKEEESPLQAHLSSLSLPVSMLPSHFKCVLLKFVGKAYAAGLETVLWIPASVLTDYRVRLSVSILNLSL